MINLKLLINDAYKEIVKPFLYTIRHFVYCTICVSPLLYASTYDPKNYDIYIFGFIGSLFIIFIMTVISKYRDTKYKK